MFGNDFEGFNKPDGFTPIPNEYLEYTYSHESNLSLVDIKIMNLFFRQTLGWLGRDNFGIVLSVTEIQAIINSKNKNQVIDSLKKLVDKRFLEKKEVKELTKEQRENIEKSLEKKLKSNQYIYRLHLKDNPLPWDIVTNVENQIGKEKMRSMKKDFNGKTTSIKIDTGNENDTSSKNDTDTGIKIDTGNGIKTDTGEKTESLDTTGIKETPNIGLKKALKEREEEEERPSKLVSFLLTKDITMSNAKKFETRLLEKKVSGYTYEDVLEALARSFMDFENGKCDEPYIWAVGKLERLLDSKNKSKKIPTKRPQAKKESSKEVIPDWFLEQRKKSKVQVSEDTVDKESEAQEMAKILEKYKGESSKGTPVKKHVLN